MPNEAAQNQLKEIITKIEKTPGVLKCKLHGNIPRMIFGNYQCKVLFGSNETGIFGYGSFLFARDSEHFGDNTSGKYAIKVGNHSEIAGGKILLGGEHDNSKPINTTLSVFPAIDNAAREKGMKLHKSVSRGPITIGNNVTVSRNVIVLSGITIGNGAVIGAGAVVTKDVPDFAIVAGSPAQIIKYRFDEKIRKFLNEIRWWDLNNDALLEYYEQIQKLPDPTAVTALQNIPPEKYRKASEKYLVFHQFHGETGPSFIFLGAEVNGKKIFTKDLPDIFRYYVEQPKIPNTPDTWYYLIDDIFEICGL